MHGRNLLHFLKFIFGFDKPETQTSVREQELIKKCAHDALVAVEIGVFEGFNTSIIASRIAEHGKLFAVDPFFKGKLGFSYNELMATKYIKRQKQKSKIEWVEGFSWDVIDKIPSQIDFIFVDGDHSFDGVKKDYELYAAKLSANGLMAFHDARVFDKGWTRPDWGPVRLVEEVIKPSNQWEIVEEVDSLVVIKRKLNS
jgi:hypothetical protein